MIFGRSDLSGVVFLATVAVAFASVVALLVFGRPLLAFAGDRERLVLTSLAAASAFGMVSSFGIGAFWILPRMDESTREKGKLQSLTGMLQRRSQDLETAALTDPLTGMHNRRFFDEATRHYLEEFGKINRPLGFMLFDLDRFKAINDTYGHDVGDEVLRAVAACLLEFTRHHDIVARLGGEEFAVVAPNMNVSDCYVFADRLREAISRLTVRVGNVHLRVTVSVGITVSKRDDDFNQFYKRADVNLYLAKQSGRDRVCA